MRRAGDVAVNRNHGHEPLPPVLGSVHGYLPEGRNDGTAHGDPEEGQRDQEHGALEEAETDEPLVIGMLYVHKGAVKRLEDPEVITVTITATER